MASRRRAKQTSELGNIWETPDPVGMHERLGNLWIMWIAWAGVLEEAEVCLGEHAAHAKRPSGEEVMPALLAVRAMILGFALECSLKALWLKQDDNKIVRDGKYCGVTGANDHDLVQLASAAGFKATPSETEVLRHLSKFIRFAGRYPIGKTAADMKPPGLTEVDVGFFSKKEFRTAESLFNKVGAAVSGKKRRVLPRRLYRSQ